MSLFGITRQNASTIGGLFYRWDFDVNQLTYLGAVASEILVSENSPNALGYDRISNSLFYVDMATKELYRFDIAKSTNTLVGSLEDTADGATFYLGSYWYGGQGTNRLRKVMLDNQGSIFADTVVAELAGIHTYDDISFDSNGLLYLSTKLSNEETRLEIAAELATYNLDTKVYSSLRRGSIINNKLLDPTISYLGQIAFDANDNLYNQAADGGFSILDSINGSQSTMLSATLQFTDIAMAECSDYYSRLLARELLLSNCLS